MVFPFTPETGVRESITGDGPKHLSPDRGSVGPSAYFFAEVAGGVRWYMVSNSILSLMATPVEYEAAGAALGTDLELPDGGVTFVSVLT